MASPSGRRLLNNDIIWHIARHVHNYQDILNLSLSDKAAWHTLKMCRYQAEAESYLDIPFRLRRSCPISKAVRNQESTECMRIIINTHQNLDGISGVKEPPLFAATKMNRADVVGLLLEAGVWIHSRWSGDWDGCVPSVHSAGRCQITKPDEPPCPNALYVAVDSGSVDVALFLLGRDISIELKDVVRIFCAIQRVDMSKWEDVITLVTRRLPREDMASLLYGCSGPLWKCPLRSKVLDAILTS